MLKTPSNKRELESLLSNFRQWFSNYDSCYLLCFYNFYFLTNASMKTDEEIEKSGYSSMYSEALQAIALMQERVSNNKCLDSDKDQFIRQISLLDDYIKFKAFGKQKRDIPDLLDSEFIVNQMKFKTMRIQNWGYRYQMETIIRDLLNPLDKEFYKQFNVPGIIIAKLFIDLIKVLERQITVHYCKTKIIKACFTKILAVWGYEKLFGRLDDKDPDFKQLLQSDSSIKTLKERLTQFADLQLPQCYSFTAKNLAERWNYQNTESLQALLNQLSYNFKSLKYRNLDDLLLDNPVRRRPFIKLEDGGFLCVAPGLLLDRSLDVIDGLVSAVPELAQQYRT